MPPNFVPPLHAHRAHRLSVAALALFASLGAQAQLQVPDPSQDVYVGLGALSIATIGYARPINSNFGLRAEYAFGPTLSRDMAVSGADASASIKANRGGLFADWYPFSGGLRLVGGVTFNDIRLDLSAKDGSTIDINGINTSLAGETFGASVTFPTTTPYFGIGYGHQESKSRGIGFYADVGFMVGSFNSAITTSVLGQNGIRQADIDKESQSIRDKISNLNVLPSLSMGLVYRY